MASSVDFGKQLTREIGFLARSCQSYDDGFQDEAIRIATVIRILVHETKNSRPLLRRLDAMGVKLASTCGTPSERAIMYTGMGSVRFSNDGVEWIPNMKVGQIDAFVPASLWWRALVYIHGSVRLTRADIVLAAADKDGGAHVDAKLTPEYESLMNVGGNGFWSIADPDSPGKFKPIIDAHLVYLRQMGFEILSSPELLQLCRV